MTGRYDVAIVGAGPAGATCAWYLARRGIRTLLLEKREFPRDKLCGDAICSRALMHLERMGVLKQILDNDEGHPADAGGMISPGGIGYVGRSAEILGGSPVIAIKRIFLDVRIARAAAEAGATLVEHYPVADARFDPAVGEWTILRDGGGPSTARGLLFPRTARFPVLADGLGLSTARLMRCAAERTCARSCALTPTAWCFIPAVLRRDKAPPSRGA